MGGRHRRNAAALRHGHYMSLRTWLMLKPLHTQRPARANSGQKSRPKSGRAWSLLSLSVEAIKYLTRDPEGVDGRRNASINGDLKKHFPNLVFRHAIA